MRQIAAFVASLFFASGAAADTAGIATIPASEHLGAAVAGMRGEDGMSIANTGRAWIVAAGCAAAALGGCLGDSNGVVDPVVIDAGTPNTISVWNQTATTTINQPNAATGTPGASALLQAVRVAARRIAAAAIRAAAVNGVRIGVSYEGSREGHSRLRARSVLDLDQ